MPPQTPKLLVDHSKFRRLSETKPGESVVAMFYGPAKTGKTMLLGTAGNRSLFINNGAGSETLRSPLFKKMYPDSDPIIIDIHEELDANGLPASKAQAFDMMSDAIDYALQTMGDQFDTICIDDSTAARRFAMYKGLEINQASGKSKTLEDMVKRFDVLSVAVQDYGIEMNLILQFLIGTIELCKKNNKHLFIGAHERNTFKKGDKIGDAPVIMRIRPGFTGQTMPDEIGGLWDVLGHTEAVGGGSNVVYRVRFNGDEVVQAGVRYGGIFETVESDVTIPKMLERIKSAQLNPKAVRR
jgi:hypothetical protein